MKKSKLFLAPLLPLILLVVVSCWWKINYSSPKIETTNKTFVIIKGESLSSVAKKLEKESLIKNALVLKIFVRLKGLTRKIQAGNYRLDGSLDVGQIVSILTQGPVDIWLTFPEGWRKEEYTARLAVNLTNFQATEFAGLVKNNEGKLFPDTYLFSQEASPSAVFEIMLRNFSKKTKDSNPSSEDLILASIIEREVKTETDRPIVAGILKKRLENDWPLQADATIQYATGKESNWWPRITKGDLEINSFYNTYKHKGLPPAPICNPGLASIKAALNPTQTSYWFYLSDAQGQIHYANTIEEHNQNIAKYLK